MSRLYLWVFVAALLLFTNVLAVAEPATRPATAPATPPVADFLKKARPALEAIQTRCKSDPALKPLAAGEIKAMGEDTLQISVETPEEWDGFPSKTGPPFRGHGKIMVRVKQALRPEDRMWTPFIPPPGCWCGDDWLKVSDSQAVLVYSVLGDRKGHARLEEIVVEELAKAGIVTQAPPNDLNDVDWGPLPKSNATRPATQPAPAPLTVEALKNAEYRSEFAGEGKARLVDGVHIEKESPNSATFLRMTLSDIMARGDLNGDGVADAAVILVSNPGGSGTFYELCAVLNQNGKPIHAASALLGDRVRIKGMTVNDGQITARMVTQGPNDPMSTPTMEVTQKYKLEEGKLVQVK